MLTIHHLGRSQSERIIWLCEELGIPYALRHYTRDAVTMLAPPELKALHPAGTAPVLTDGAVVLAESNAIMAYIIARHGGGSLVPAPSHPDFAQYLYWFHFANGTLQPSMGRNMILRRLALDADNPILNGVQGRLRHALNLLETRLTDVPYLAGADFTAADIVTVFSLTTMRIFMPVDLTPYPHILAYLQRIGQREGYRRAMDRGDPGFAPMLS